MNTKELTPEEMELLVGGIRGDEDSEDVDVENDNKYFACQCDYNNHSVIKNTNEVNGCTCRCI